MSCINEDCVIRYLIFVGLDGKSYYPSDSYLYDWHDAQERYFNQSDIAFHLFSLSLCYFSLSLFLSFFCFAVSAPSDSHALRINALEFVTSSPINLDNEDQYRGLLTLLDNVEQLWFTATPVVAWVRSFDTYMQTQTGTHVLVSLFFSLDMSMHVISGCCLF